MSVSHVYHSLSENAAWSPQGQATFSCWTLKWQLHLWTEKTPRLHLQPALRPAFAELASIKLSPGLFLTTVSQRTLESSSKIITDALLHQHLWIRAATVHKVSAESTADKEEVMRNKESMLKNRLSPRLFISISTVYQYNNIRILQSHWCLWLVLNLCVFAFCFCGFYSFSQVITRVYLHRVSERITEHSPLSGLRHT